MRLQLLEKKQENPETITFFFKPEEEIIFKPGQFLRYHIPDPSPDGRGENHFFSIAAAPFENHIQLTTKFNPAHSSTFKEDLKRLEAGQSIEAFGPSGHFIIEDPNQDYVFIAGGIGITPFRSIILDLDYRKQPINITLLYANRNKEPLFKNEFEEIASRHPEFKIIYVISEETVEEKQLSSNIEMTPGKIDDDLIQLKIKNLKLKIFYISGPEPMVESFEEILKQMGVPKENTKRDYFPGYESF